ncbi:bacteriohemerythrin [candidate division KSB1 bacterium]
MEIIWNDELLTGIHWIDNQHKNLVNRIRSLFEALEKGAGRAEATRLIAFLESYTDSHFRQEEQLMQKLRYPEYAFHKEAHGKFRETFGAMKKAISSPQITGETLKHVQYELWEYFKYHLSVIDAALAEFIQKKVRESGGG